MKRKIRLFTVCSFMLCILLCLNVQVQAQTQTKTIHGTITDESGKPLSGATVTVKGTSTVTQTDAAGNFTLNSVPVNSTFDCFVCELCSTGSKCWK